ncbi:hypothetical protein [Rhabdaerophilum sp. SD176]|uniref:hypothetical protein n=1 Tax=Rhabdaerophilum sp. SD176 TaxID=2983548 RepID=UPI0024DF811D|nr:hypothetical protein [Rhabdaerophilum sp. SD176]
MHDLIQRTAHLSVIRGCGFGVLGIITAMTGLANDLPLALHWGGLSMLLMSFILLLKAARVHQVSFRSTEVWILIPDNQRPPEALAAGIIARARREAFLVYAYRSAIVAGLMLALQILIIAFR